MRITTRLALISAGTLAALAVLLLGVGLSFAKFRSAKADYLLADQIQDNCVERAAILDQYLLYREDRAQAMWEQRKEAADQLVGQARLHYRRQEDRQNLEQLCRNLDENSTIFRRIVANSARLNPADASQAIYLELDKRLVSQLLLKAMAVRNAAADLQNSTEQRVDETFRRLAFIVGFFGFTVALITALITQQISRMIRQRLGPLHAGLTRLAEGDLEHRILGAGSDEFSDLARSVNAMADKLQGSTQQLGEEISRRLVVSAKQESERRFRAWFDLPLIGICMTSSGKGWLEVNDHLCTLLGYEREGLLTKTWAELTHPEDLQVDVAQFERVMRGELEGYALEKRFLRKDGGILQAEIAVRCVRKDDGSVDYVVTLIQDITERKRAEAALHEVQERMRFAMASSHTGAWDLDLTDHSAFRTLEHDQIFGYETLLPEWTYERFLEHVLPEDRAEADRTFQWAVRTQGNWDFECRIIRRDGLERWIWACGQHRMEADSGKTRMAGIVQDITERKQAEREVMESEAKYRQLLKNLTAGVVVHGPDTAILFANPMAGTLLGLSADQLRGKTALDPHWCFVKEDGSPLPLEEYPVNRVLASGQGFHGQVLGVFRPELPKPVWVLCNAFPERDEKGAIRQVVVTFTDISERKVAEAEKADLQSRLQQSQKMESLGVLAGGVAHDMNNVLGAILSLSSAHLEIQPAATPTFRAFETITKAANRGREMVKKLLGFARKGLVETSELDLNLILREEISLLERTTLARVHLVVDLAEDLRPMSGDASALTHAFMNLCVNAVDAMPDQGTLTLRTRNVDNGWLEVEIEDSGTGMSKEILAKALDPFFTTKGVGKGTGLGLSLVYSTVQSHLGQMDIKSEPGRGTCVRLRFPACVSAPILLPNLVPGVTPSGRSLKVLLVDDDDLIRSSSQLMLDFMGHTTTLAASGEEALAALAGGLQPDVVILDMNMPGLGGTGTLPRLRLLYPNLPVLLATGRVDQVALDLVQGDPQAFMMPKPFSLNELKQHLQGLGLG